MTILNKILWVSAVSGLTAAGLTQPQPTLAAEYYKGKTISVIVGRGAGGGTDTVARIMAKHLGKHIPGNPGVVVKNMPGAGGSKSMNFIYEKAKPDGRTIVYANLSAMNEILEAKGVRYIYGKFSWIGAVQGPPIMMFARIDVVPGGLKRPSDIIKAKNLILPGQRPSGTLDLMSRPTLDMMGLKYRYVPGYRGASGIRPAIRAGEGNIAAHGLNGWRSGVEPTMAKTGIVKALWYYPNKDASGKYVKSKLVPEMQTVIEVYKEIFGKEPSGKYWEALELPLGFRATASNAFLSPPNTNKAALAALRIGFNGMINDPKMISDLMKSTGSEMIPVKVEVALALYNNLKNVDPEKVKFWKDYISEGAKAKKAPKDKRGGKRKKKK